MTKAQEIYERVNTLVEQGTSKADAFRQVAEEYKQPFNSMRGAYYAHQRTLTGSDPAEPTTERARRTLRPRPIYDPVESARSILEGALTQIDNEIEIARMKADDAKAAYEQLLETADERRTALQTKIAALISS